MSHRKSWIASALSLFSLLAVTLSCASAVAAQGSDAEKVKLPSTLDADSTGGNDAAERVSIENIKQKYWARGDENELGVVQNRMYTKDHKFEFGLYGGVVSTDPFLTVYSASFTFGYHFSEYLSMDVLAMKDWASPSSALVFLRNPYPNGAGSDTSTNAPSWYLGVEGLASVMYGKLSVIGKAIIHYDFHFIGGLGMINTFSGTYFAPHLGVGQEFFVTRAMTIRLDYRLMMYNETILQQVGSATSPNGTPLGTRFNFSNSISLGVSFLFGKSAPATAPAPTDAAKGMKP